MIFLIIKIRNFLEPLYILNSIKTLKFFRLLFTLLMRFPEN